MATNSDAERIVTSYLQDVLTGAGPASAAQVISNPILRQRVAAFRRAFGDLQITPQVLITVDDYAAVHFSARGVHRGAYRGIQPTGRAWTTSAGGIFRVQDGRIADFWLVWDTASILEQIGAKPCLPSIGRVELGSSQPSR